MMTNNELFSIMMILVESLYCYFKSCTFRTRKGIVMIHGHSQFDTNGTDELDEFLSVDHLNEFDMGKYTMKLLPGSDRLYQLKTDRAVRFMNNMNMYRQQELFCDISLRIKNHRYLAHRVILASVSPYFASMFGKSGHIEAHTVEDIDLTKLIPCPATMNIILNFLYTSQIQLNDKCVSKGYFDVNKMKKKTYFSIVIRNI